MRNLILYVGIFKLPDVNAAAVRVQAVADALRSGGYQVQLIGDANGQTSECDVRTSGWQRIRRAMARRSDTFFTAQSYIAQIGSVDWSRVAAVICYPGTSALITRLQRICRKSEIPLIIDSTEWYEPSHTSGGMFGPVAIDSELRMRWIYPRVGNILCISSYLAQFYALKGCNVLRVPPLLGERFSSPAAPLKDGSDSSEEMRLVYAGFPGSKELLGEIILGVESARASGVNASLQLVGISESQLGTLMAGAALPSAAGEFVYCHGRVPRERSMDLVTGSDYTVLLRPRKRFAQAGFPSKVVESLGLGVPVITNAVSDLSEYIHDGVNGFLCEPTAQSLRDALVRAARLTGEERRSIRERAALRARESFGYQQFTSRLVKFVEAARV